MSSPPIPPFLRSLSLSKEDEVFSIQENSLGDCPTVRPQSSLYPALKLASGAEGPLARDFSYELSYSHSSSISADYTTSEAIARLIGSGFSNAAAMIAKPWLNFCIAGLQRSTQSNSLHLMVRYDLTRAVLRTIDIPSPSPGIVEPFGESVSDTNKLISTLDRFGHVLPTEVLFGGAIVTKLDVAHDAFSLEPENICECLKMVFEDRLGLRPLSDHDITEDERVVINYIRRKMNITVLGGTAAPISNKHDLDRWVESLKDPATWESIRVNGVVPIVNLLEKEYPVIYRHIASKVLWGLRHD